MYTKHFYSGQPWWRSGLAPPAAQGVILETLDGVPRQALCNWFKWKLISSPPGHLEMLTLLFVTDEVRVCYWHLISRDKRCCSTPYNAQGNRHKIKLSGPNINSPKVEKPCSRIRSFLITSFITPCCPLCSPEL